MTINDHMAAGLQANLGMLKGALADFSDADLFVRPVPNANHANWQLGHLLVSENHLLSMAGAKMPPLPAGFADRYSKATASVDDPAKFLPRQQLLGLFDTSRAAAVDFAKSLSPEQLETPSPEPIRGFAPTVGDLIIMMSVHTAMHVGQFQVIRRKLGKPILF